MAYSLLAACNILVTWVAVAGCFIGLGLALQKRYGITNVDNARLLDAFWVGFALVICVLQIWHLFLPITGVSLGLFGLAGIAGLWFNGTGIRDWWQSHRVQKIWPALACLLFMGVWTAHRASGPPTEWDTGVYHAPAVRWTKAFAVIPGLGNLNERMAFNSSSLLYDAMLDSGPWRGRATHLGNGLIVLMALIQVVLSGLRLLEAGEVRKGAAVFDFVFLAPLIAIVISEDISSFTTDIPTAMVLFAASSRLFCLLTAPAMKELDLSWNAWIVVIINILAVCLKSSALALAPASIVVAVWYVARSASRTGLVQFGRLSVVSAVLLGIPWALHGIILSGYFLFPITTSVGLPVAWRMPRELVQASAAWILVFARHSELRGWAWVPVWFRSSMHWTWQGPLSRQMSSGILAVFVPLAISIGMVCIQALVRSVRGPVKSEPRQGGGLLVAVPVMIGAVLWFVAAPAPRFGFSLFWILAATTTSWSLMRVQPRGVYVLSAGLALACSVIIFPTPPLSSGPVGFLGSLTRRLILTPGPDRGMHPMEQAELDRFTTDSGLVLFVPGYPDIRCFNAELFCTPFPAPNILLQHVLDGRPEFITNGPWRQVNWPNRGRTEFGKRFMKY